MPLYPYYCHSCGEESENFAKISDRKQFMPCPYCGGMAERTIASNIQRNEPTWLEDAKRQLHSDNRHTIRDRNDFNRYLKREGIEQIG